MADRRVVFHLHCYQPPRESPWTGAVPREPSAAPYHDWNERITDECYLPLSAARVLDADGRVHDAHNLFRDVSFNVGPTLHSWLATHAPEVDTAVRLADREPTGAHDGRGPAIAQPYVHAILPLATARDRNTLVRWGIADFQRRFGRAPEGMWLPETAVDVSTLECLAAHHIGFTILGPQQAARVRAPGGEWAPAPGTLDSSRPYRVTLPSGRTITVCFFDGPLSQAVAFDRDLLESGARLGEVVANSARLAAGPRLVVIATDGETFGHHHRFGEMALARALVDLTTVPEVVVGGIAAYLAAHPPTHEVEIASPSAWSCAHGVERWRTDCGDVTGGEPHWNQRWRAPLRVALDRLAERCAALYEQAAATIVVDPWLVRDEYGTVLDAPVEARVDFVLGHAQDPHLDRASVGRMLALLEMERHVLFAFSSCAWFFADCAGLETRLSLRHAARAVELARTLTGVDLDGEVVSRLAAMRSNEPADGDGRTIWRRVRRGAVPLSTVAACWAALTVAGRAPRSFGRIRLEVQAQHSAHDGPDTTVMVTGTITVHDDATLTSETFDVAAVAWGAHLVGGVGTPGRGAPLADPGALLASSPAAAAAAIEAAFGSGRFTLPELPVNAQSRVVECWLEALRFRTHLPDLGEVRRLHDTARAVGLDLDAPIVVELLRRVAPGVVEHAAHAPVAGLRDLAWLVDALGDALPARLRWRAQNAVLAARDRVRPRMHARAADGDRDAQRWLDALAQAAEALGIGLDGAGERA